MNIDVRIGTEIQGCPEPIVALAGGALPIAHPCPDRKTKGFWIPSGVSTKRGDRMCGVRSPVTAI
jgi:hypothetical protein